jgi:hypothetical protein
MRRFFLMLAFLFFAILPGINAAAQLTQSPIDVAYIVSSSGIETYDVDPQTGIPTDEGLTVVVPSNFLIVPSANGQFLYVFGANPSTNAAQLWVYTTNSLGVPHARPIQHLNVPNMYTFSIDPNGTLAYGVESTQNSQYETVADIRLFEIDPATGLVTRSKIVATYPPNGPCSSNLDSASLSIIGFNAIGNKMYDTWFCSFHESTTVTYYTRSVNQSTGGLGADKLTFTWGAGTGGGFDTVVFTAASLIDFHVPNDYQVGINSINIYPPSGGTSPLFTCTATSLEACGYGTGIKVDLSGNYIFVQTSPDNTQITRLDLPGKSIAATGYYVAGQVLAFSPDDTLVYSETAGQGNPYILPIYTFDSTTGGVSTTNGAEIAVQQPFFTLVASVRK